MTIAEILHVHHWEEQGANVAVEMPPRRFRRYFCLQPSLMIFWFLLYYVISPYCDSSGHEKEMSDFCRNSMAKMAKAAASYWAHAQGGEHLWPAGTPRWLVQAPASLGCLLLQVSEIFYYLWFSQGLEGSGIDEYTNEYSAFGSLHFNSNYDPKNQQKLVTPERKHYIKLQKMWLWYIQFSIVLPPFPFNGRGGVLVCTIGLLICRVDYMWPALLPTSLAIILK
jgi:hypothetical protein